MTIFRPERQGFLFKAGSYYPDKYQRLFKQFGCKQSVSDFALITKNDKDEISEIPFSYFSDRTDYHFSNILFSVYSEC